MFLGLNMFLALLRAHFSPYLRLGQKWAWVGLKTYSRPRTATLLLYHYFITQREAAIKLQQFMHIPVFLLQASSSTTATKIMCDILSMCISM